jgi:hypothetical protein
VVCLFFLSFFALWNFEFPAKIKKGGGIDPPDPLSERNDVDNDANPESWNLLGKLVFNNG